MKKRLTNRQKRGPRARRQGKDFTMMRHPLSMIDPDALKLALTSIAKKKSEEFPVLLQTLRELITTKNPLHILATLASYGTVGAVSEQGVSDTSIVKNVEQHHVELFQALALSVPLDEWGQSPAIPDDIQRAIDTLGDVAEAFHQRRFAAIDREHDEQTRTVLNLQERLRLKTQAVRNWGYFSHMMQISTELYAPLDERLRDHYGFGATDVITIGRALVLTMEGRISSRFKILRKIFRERKIQRLVRRYYALYPGVVGDPEEFIGGIPGGVTLDMVRSRLLAHADLSLPELLTFSVNDAAAQAHLRPDVVTKTIEALSLLPGALKDDDPEHFFMSNPVWRAPIISADDKFFCALPQSIFSHIHEIMRQLTDAAGLKQPLEERLAAYLEDKVEAVLKGALPSGQMVRGGKWRIGQTEYETDHIVKIDRTILIVEDKSATLSAAALRGAPDRVKRHVRDLLLAPSIQSERLEAEIRRAKAGDAQALANLADLGLHFADVEQIVRISVTLDDFSALSSAEGDLKAAVWIPAHAELAATIHVADLQCVADILDRPSFFIHYLTERGRFQRAVRFFADEMDLVGFYLDTGFNVWSIEKEEHLNLVLTGQSKAVDRYYNSRDAGVALEKPRPKLQPYFKRLIEGIESRAFPGWLGVTGDLLRAASFDEGKRLERMLAQLKSKVERNWRNPEHECSIVVTPPPIRETAIVFHAYPQKLADRRKETAAQLAEQALETSRRHRCILIGRNIDRWDEPYSFISVVNAKKSGSENSSPT